jgi:hypothetical protein
MSRTSTETRHELPPAVRERHDIGSTDETIDLMMRWFREYGDTYRVYSPARASWTWVVHDPRIRVLVTNHRNYIKGAHQRVKLCSATGS